MSTRPDSDESDDVAAVDLSLIDALLALTPEQRLLQNDRMLQTIQDLRDGFATRRAHDSTVPAGGERR
jgi:hypothetical protein